MPMNIAPSAFYGIYFPRGDRPHFDARRGKTLSLCHRLWLSCNLSPASVRSMELQGRVFNAEEVQEFRQRSHGEDALNLRRWDDLAKDPEATTPDFAHFWQMVEEVSLADS